MFKHFLFSIFVSIVFISGVSGAADFAISAKDRNILKNAVKYSDQKKYDLARVEAKKADDSDILNLILWMQYQNSYGGNNYKDISAFIRENPSWPRERILRNMAEQALTDDIPASKLIEYFKTKEPITGHAMRLLAEAKIKTLDGGDSAVNVLLRQAWVQGDFSRDEETKFLKDHARRLREADFVGRIDRLLWEGKVSAAERIIGKVSHEYRKLFTARIYLIQKKHSVDYMVSGLSDKLKNDSGLLYERVKWQQKRKNYDRIYEYLARAKGTMPHQEKWWDAKNWFIREMLDEGKYRIAYDVAINHGNEQGSEDYADAEWLAGWIALSFVDKKSEAYTHFYNMYQNVNFPISKARAAYWAGRAAEETSNDVIATNWYNIAAKYPTTFYGQMAYLKVYPNQKIKLPQPLQASSEIIVKHRGNKLVKMAYLLVEVDKKYQAEWFINQAVDQTENPEGIKLISDMGFKWGRNEFSVIAAKRAIRKDVVLVDTGWPVLKRIPDSSAEKPLVMGIVRQESRFDERAKSHANANGLMQIIPDTAKRVARQLNVRYSTDKLLSDPYYNMQLGSKYIGDLVDQFDGSYVLAIASYNAGPTNARKWVRANGDPRLIASPEGVINWIERIPFKETRNYVQRVLENVQVYRYLINGKKLELDADLMRSQTKVSSN